MEKVNEPGFGTVFLFFITKNGGIVIDVVAVSGGER
jgi:hypothetical protein